jgi:hypothetical protein
VEAHYLDHVDGLDGAGGEHLEGTAVDEGLDQLSDTGGRHRSLQLLLLPEIREASLGGDQRRNMREWGEMYMTGRDPSQPGGEDIHGLTLDAGHARR